MKLRIRCKLERTLEVDKDNYVGVQSVPEMLQLEKGEFNETLIMILDDPETKREVELTMLDKNGIPMGQLVWED